MPSYVTPKNGVEYIFYVSLVSQANTKIFQANPTLAAGDFKVSIDGGAEANPATLPAVTPASSKRVKITLSTSEMTGDNITLTCSDASGAEWCDLTINIQTSARQIDDLSFPTTSGRSTDVTATGAVGVDWGNVENPATALGLTNTTVGIVTLTNTLTTYTGNTPQTGDNFARLGAAGAGLTAVPWNAAWDAEVQSEVNDALVVINLDHLMGASSTDGDVAQNSVIAKMVSKGVTADFTDFNNDTDSLEAIRDRGDAAWITGTGTSVLTQADVRTAVGLASANLDTQLDALPTNAELATALGTADDATLAAIAALPTAGTNADAVWDEARSGHSTAGTFGESFNGIVNATAVTGTLSTTAFTTNLTEVTDDHYNGRIVVWLTGVLIGQATDITDYTGATKLITVTAMTEAPSNADRFVII